MMVTTPLWRSIIKGLLVGLLAPPLIHVALRSLLLPWYFLVAIQPPRDIGTLMRWLGEDNLRYLAWVMWLLTPWGSLCSLAMVWVIHRWHRSGVAATTIRTRCVRLGMILGLVSTVGVWCTLLRRHTGAPFLQVLFAEGTLFYSVQGLVVGGICGWLLFRWFRSDLGLGKACSVKA